MNKLAGAAALAAMIVVTPALAKQKVNSGAQPGELILYQQADFAGDYYTVDSDMTSIQTDWNIRSIAIKDGEKWQICARPRYRDCIELSQSLRDASVVGITAQIGSVRKLPAK